MLLGVLILIAGVLSLFAERMSQFYSNNEKRINEIIERFTAVFVTMQILNLLNENHIEVGGAEVSAPYNAFLKSFDVVNLDVVQFVPFSCIYSGGFGHMDALLLMTLPPLAILAYAALHSFVIKRRKGGRTEIFSLVLQGLILVLPTISRRICHSFRLVE